MEVIETLPSEKKNDFLSDLSKVFIIANWTYSDSPAGRCIRLTFENGTFEIISYSKDNERLISMYNENGAVIEYVGSIDGRADFITLVNKHFNTQLE